MTAPDPRLTLATPDLAAAWLEGVVAARRYVQPKSWVCAVPFAPIRRAPGEDAEQSDQLLFGERFEVLDDADGWGFGQARRDGYVGYVAMGMLAPTADPPTHWVSVTSAHAFAEPDIKAHANGPYAINSLVTVEAREGRFARVAGAGATHASV